MCDCTRFPDRLKTAAPSRHRSVEGDATDDDLADCMVAALRGAAACRGPGLVEALNRRLGEAS